MPKAPVSKLKKSEVVWLASHYCKHGHNYLQHYSCYLKEQPQRNRIGYFDIETSNLSAAYGIVLCYCILDESTGKILKRSITNKELHTCLDKKVVSQCIRDLKKFDRIITFYGKRFDLPFVRTRALTLGLEFPGFGEILHDDIYFIVKHRFKLSSNRMESACRVLLGETEKTHIDPLRWIKALRGDGRAISWILDHCKRDVRDLQRLHRAINGFARRQDASI